MNGSCLKIYVHENRRHHGQYLYDWLLLQARKLGIHGGSVYRTLAGYGRHGVLHEAHFFELAGDLPVVVEFILSDEEADRLLALMRQEKVSAFFMRMPVVFGLIAESGEPVAPPPWQEKHPD